MRIAQQGVARPTSAMDHPRAIGSLGSRVQSRFTDSALARIFSRTPEGDPVRPRLRTAALTGYAGLARSLGLDPVVLMNSVGLDIEDLDFPDRWVLASQVARLLEVSAQESGCADFGLRLVPFRRLGTLGPLSVVLRDEPDLRSAVQLLARYERAYNEALHLRLDETQGLAAVEVWLAFGEPVPSNQSIDLVMGALVGILRTLVGSEWEPLVPTFARPEPPDPTPYRRLFGPGVRFDGTFTGLLFPSRDLDAPVVIADPSLRPYTHALLDTVGDGGASTTAGQVADIVELLLPLGSCSVTEVARYLGLRPRALQRSLADDGESFSGIVHAVRARLAERYLSHDGYSLTEVSQQLGFDAPSAFSRWFRQQFGMTAVEWRRTTHLMTQDYGRTVPEG
jgi:AraC-like DNA-binding protein